ncbi:hypothetical protein [Metasolibacillus meyeri]|uniref:hypothetical protein n=1 Tax=Metasolibacillus meyeri TaxID=1071052 RepID=UPI00398B48EF
MNRKRGGIGLLLVVIILFSVFYLFQINRMTYALCMRKEIPEEKQPKIFRTINVLITILLVSFYMEVLFTV